MGGRAGLQPVRDRQRHPRRQQFAVRAFLVDRHCRDGRMPGHGDRQRQHATAERDRQQQPGQMRRARPQAQGGDQLDVAAAEPAQLPDGDPDAEGQQRDARGGKPGQQATGSREGEPEHGDGGDDPIGNPPLPGIRPGSGAEQDGQGHAKGHAEKASGGGHGCQAVPSPCVFVPSAASDGFIEFSSKVSNEGLPAQFPAKS
jgi:hypothetical protein